MPPPDDSGTPSAPRTAVVLLPIDLAGARLLAAEPAAFEAAHDVRLGDRGDFFREVAAQTASYLERTGARHPWASYIGVDPTERALVGVCAFKGGPDSDGTVEIAYGTVPGGEGRGVATAMARELVAVAARSAGAARMVIAHTLPTPGPSPRVLEKSGFRFAGDVVDPEDGPVWRWELPL